MATENALNESEHSQLNVRSSLDGVHVLLVEDSEDLRTLFTRIFTRCGSTVRSFESAEEALEIVGTFKPDIIISDINLPNESGIAFLRRVRMMDLVNRQYTPAVAVTAYAHLKHEIFQAGYDGLISKPATGVDLLATVTAILAQRRSEH